MVLRPPVNKNLFIAPEAEGLGLETLPATLEEAVAVAEESEFLHKVLPEELAKRYLPRSSSAAPPCDARRPGGVRAHPLLQRHLIPAQA